MIANMIEPCFPPTFYFEYPYQSKTLCRLCRVDLITRDMGLAVETHAIPFLVTLLLREAVPARDKLVPTFAAEATVASISPGVPITFSAYLYGDPG